MVGDDWQGEGHCADERSRSGPGVIRTGTSADSSVVQLDIDGAVQNFTATDVHPDDIETYRAK
ncbi:MAG: hypothetical protein R2848_18385 [Thermomicrobiales bacterium]